MCGSGILRCLNLIGEERANKTLRQEEILGRL
jgi:hypothetical protein